jgi:hypothetical protein
MTPQPTCWLALGELAGSMHVPSPGLWAWTPCIFTGGSGCGCTGGLGEWLWEVIVAAVPSLSLQAQWTAVSTRAGPSRCGSRSTGALLPVLHP